MDQRISDWLRRGEHIYHEAKNHCRDIERQIAALNEAREAHQRQLEAMERIFRGEPARPVRKAVAPTPPSLRHLVSSEAVARAFMPANGSA